MASRGCGGSRQLDLFPRSERPTIPLRDDHPLVMLTDTVDWIEMEVRAQKIRTKKLKNSIVRGKVGKAVEFGLSWGITRLRGGFILATMARDRQDLHDSRFAVRAVEDLAALFGEAPRAYAYDRAGHSADNVW